MVTPENQNDFLLVLFEEFRKRPFHLLAGASQANSSGHFKYGDVGVELFALDGENHGGLATATAIGSARVGQPGWGVNGRGRE